MNETWKSIAGYEELYEVSDLGRVRSLSRLGTQRRILRPQIAGNGYLVVGLCCEGKTRRQRIHRLVLEAFVGPAPDGMECCHFPDPDPTNNRLENLRWGTAKENASHKKIHGTDNVGERNPFAKLTAFKVRWIRRLYATGVFTQRELAEAFEVTHAAIVNVVGGRRWTHIL